MITIRADQHRDLRPERARFNEIQLFGTELIDVMMFKLVPRLSPGER
jgi:hypothetical protein